MKDDAANPLGLEGQVLASKYRVTARIGEGGMGVVYSGEHVELKTPIAIKVLQPSLAGDDGARARFLREARLAASIQAEHCGRIFDVGTDDTGRPFMVMELLSGEPVDALLAREGRTTPEVAVTILLQLLDVLSEAHAKGLVHRDLKPANLFLVDKPGESIWVKVLDFGISKRTEPTNERTSFAITEPHSLLGSPEYMSPEQLRDSAQLDTRSDLWACGVILFELLTGTTPFDATTLPDLCAQIVSRPPRSFASVGADHLPSSLERVIERCLRKDPAERPANAYELAIALAPHANESARALLPRIRAWCKSELAPPEPPRVRRVTLGGLGLVGIAGALAFVAASLVQPSRPSSADVRAPLATLRPLAAPPAPSTHDASAPASSTPPPSPTPTPTATTSSAVAASATASAPQRPASSAASKPRRIRDLDAIELLE